MLEKIIADSAEDLNTYVMYDIACTLFSHLEVIFICQLIEIFLSLMVGRIY